MGLFEKIVNCGIFLFLFYVKLQGLFLTFSAATPQESTTMPSQLTQTQFGLLLDGVIYI